MKWIKENKLLLLILFVGAVLRFYKVDFQSLWIDEVLSMNDANPATTLSETNKSVLFWEAMPPLYFVILKYILTLFGYTTLIARLLSAVIGVVGIYAMYLLGKEMYNKRCGLLCASIVCINIYHIFYSQEVRPYGFLFLFTTLAYYRLIIFIKKRSYKNAFLYALFAGLSVNFHFFGLLPIFSQYLILLFFILKEPKQLKIKLFLYSFFAGIIILLLIWPTYKAFIHLGEIKTFWVLDPTWDSPILIFNEFFGKSKWVLFIIYSVLIYYLYQLITDKLPRKSIQEIINNKLFFSSIILIVWIFVAIFITMVKSYMDLSVMFSRYLIIILPAIFVIIAIGFELIKNKIIKYTLLISLIALSLIDVFYINDYYNKITKAQLRELTNEIKLKNSKNAKIVSFYSFIYPYYFLDNSKTHLEGSTFEDYIKGLRNNSISHVAFWYTDVNSRPYSLNAEDEKYLKENFQLKEKLEYFDTWANYYVPLHEEEINIGDNLVKFFSPVVFDTNGSMLIFNNAFNIISPFFELKKGNYKLIVEGNSLPAKPINNENAHIKIKINGNQIGEYYLSENALKKEKILNFSIEQDTKTRIQLIYDNDVFENGNDRNVIIYSIAIKNKDK